MSDNFNIRDFRNAHVDEPKAKSDKLFWSCVIATPIIAAVAGLSYQPLMAMRTGNVEAIAQAQYAVEQDFRDQNPGKAMLADMRSGKMIDLNTSVSSRAPGNSFKNKAMSVNEFLYRADAKEAGFTESEMETLKYRRARSALITCEYRDLSAFYTRQNKAKYDRLKNSENKIKEAASKARAEKFDTATTGLEIPNIETKAQAMAFVASGGVRRHQEAAFGRMSGFSGLQSDMGKLDVTMRRQKFNKKNCMQVRSIIQSGSMHLK